MRIRHKYKVVRWASGGYEHYRGRKPTKSDNQAASHHNESGPSIKHDNEDLYPGEWFYLGDQFVWGTG